jgi:hypothetical protein
MKVIGKDEVCSDPIHVINYKQGVHLVERLFKRFDIYQLNCSSTSLCYFKFVSKTNQIPVSSLPALYSSVKMTGLSLIKLSMTEPHFVESSWPSLSLFYFKKNFIEASHLAARCSR